MPAAFRTLLNPTGGGDPYFSAVSLLMHFDGANGSTTFTDSSSNALAVTASGNAQISTSSPKFGSGAGTFDGTGDYLTWTGNAGFNFGVGDFTIEMFFKMPSGMSLGTFGRVLLSNENASWGAGAFTLYGVNSTTGRPTFWINDYSSGSPLLTCSSGDYRDSTWHHLAIVRSGSSCVMYIDGTSVATATFSGQVGSSSRNLVLATNLVSGRDLQVDVDELRITRFARYTANFTPPTAAFSDLVNPFTTLPVSGAALWLSAPQTSSLYTDAGATNVIKAGDAVYQWNDLSGNSRNATQTTSGNRPTWVAPASGRNGLGAVAFNGSQTILTSWNGANFGTGDFTIEAWIKTNDATNIKAIAGTLKTGFDGGWQIRTGAGKFYFGIGISGGIELADSATISTGVWYHVAVCRSNGTLRTFVNGVSGGSLANSSNITNTNLVNVGFDGGSTLSARIWNGQIQNLLIYNGQALYTSNFTPWMS